MALRFGPYTILWVDIPVHKLPYDPLFHELFVNYDNRIIFLGIHYSEYMDDINIYIENISTMS